MMSVSAACAPSNGPVARGFDRFMNANTRVGWQVDLSSIRTQLDVPNWDSYRGDGKRPIVISSLWHHAPSADTKECPTSPNRVRVSRC
jgi:hypothetical protein